jgi:flavin-dependent dehydrogenase
VCGDALIPDAVRALERLGLKQRVLRRSRVLDGVRVYAPDGQFIDVHGDCACLPRRQFDEMLRAEAVNAGARFLPGVNVRNVLVDDDTVVGVDLGTSRVRADVTLLATGAAAEPLKRFGVCHRIAPSATAARVYARTDERFARTFTHLCISYDTAICPGYGWIFPGPGATFNLGVGYYYDAKRPPPEKNVRKLLERFVRTFPPAADVMRHRISVTELRGAPLRTALCGSALSRPGLLVLGEAAGLTYSFSGEGIGKALESGIIAADVVAGCGRRDEGAAKVMADTYSNRIREDCGPRFRAYKMAQDWLSNPTFANLLAHRASKSRFVQRELSGLFLETTDPRRLFSLAGMMRSLVS